MFDTFETNALELNTTVADTTNNDAYGLDALPTSEPSITYVPGTLDADIFSIDSSYDVNIISGNGNLSLGLGYYDLLDLSSVSIDDVVNYSLAQADEGGIKFDVGNGERVFDYMELADGTEILFEGLDGVVFADDTIDLTITPNDTYYSTQWNLHMMGVQNAWRFTQGAEEILIGVQDTGLGIDGYGNIHPDLGNTFYYTEDNLADDFLSHGNPDSSSHGTAVQGIITAEANNEMGIAGINWNSDVYNIDVLGGNTGDISSAEAAQAMIDLAESQGQQLIINMSLGTDSFDILAESHEEFEQLVADNPDVLFAIAAGNSGDKGEIGIASPAILARDYNNVMAIGASWGNVSESGFSVELGTRADYSQYGEGLTLMGPTSVMTTDAIPGLGFDYNTGFNGTSAATPNVAGVASLVWSANQDLTPAEIKEILSETAYDLGDAGYDLLYGSGFINADAAVRRAIALKSTTEVTPEIDDTIEDVPPTVPGIENAIDDFISNILLDANDNTAETDTEVDFLEIPTSDTTSVTANLFDYEAAGMTDIIDMNRDRLQAELLTDNPLYSQLVDDLVAA